MKTPEHSQTAELAPRAGLQLLRVRSDVSSPGQPGLGGATAMIAGKLSSVSAAARVKSGTLEFAIARFNNRCGSRGLELELEEARVGWIAGTLYLFAECELEVPA